MGNVITLATSTVSYVIRIPGDFITQPISWIGSGYLIKRRAEANDYYVRVAYQASKEDLSSALSDQNLWGFSFTGHGNSETLYAYVGVGLFTKFTLKEFKIKDICSAGKTRGYRPGKVILNSCYSNSDILKKAFNALEFKGHSGVLFPIPKVTLHEW